MNKRLIIKLGTLLAIIVFIVVSLSFTTVERKTLHCSSISVVFSENYQYVTPAYVESVVKKKFASMNGALLDTLNTNTIEAEVEKIPWVRKAEIFKGYAMNDSVQYSGKIKIKITQESPVLRVVHGADGYYLNENGKKLPFSDTYTSNVVVVTGNTPDSLMVKQVLPFVRYIRNDDFWRSQVQQIHIKNNAELILIPRVGEHQIQFGRIEMIEKKFRNLKAVYEKGLPNAGWNKYKEISLKFDNQVVCTLR